MRKNDPVEAGRSAVQAGAPVDTVVWAKENMSNKEFIGWCQKFVGQATGGLTKGATALEAWKNAPNKIESSKGIQPGDAVYFDGAEGLGHAAIYSGDNKIISGGYGESDLGEWGKQNNQNFLGYVPQKTKNPVLNVMRDSEEKVNQDSPTHNENPMLKIMQGQ